MRYSRSESRYRSAMDKLSNKISRFGNYLNIKKHLHSLSDKINNKTVKEIAKSTIDTASIMDTITNPNSDSKVGTLINKAKSRVTPKKSKRKGLTKSEKLARLGYSADEIKRIKSLDKKHENMINKLIGHKSTYKDYNPVTKLVSPISDAYAGATLGYAPGSIALKFAGKVGSGVGSGVHNVLSRVANVVNPHLAKNRRLIKEAYRQKYRH